MFERVVYHTGERDKSYQVCKRIAASTGFRLEHVKNYETGTVPIVYGLFRGTEVAMRTAYWSDIPYFYVDHGYFKFSHYDGYYRIVRNGMLNFGALKTDQTRFDALGLTAYPMRTPGHLTVICKPNLQGCFFLPQHKVWPEEWVEGLTWWLQSIGHIVVVSDKNKNPVSEMTLKDIRIVIGHDSAVMAWALLRGVAAGNWSQDNRTLYTSRDQKAWLSHFANHQFKLAELTKEHFL